MSGISLETVACGQCSFSLPALSSRRIGRGWHQACSTKTDGGWDAHLFLDDRCCGRCNEGLCIAFILQDDRCFGHYWRGFSALLG